MRILQIVIILSKRQKIIKINLGNISTYELIQILSDLLPLLEKVLHRERFLIGVDKDGTYTVDQSE